MNESDFSVIVNNSHEAFLKKLAQIKKSDSSFPFWLRSAATNLCVNSEDADLKGKLKHADDLAKAVKEGFDWVKDFLSDLSKEERYDMECSQALFAETFEGKSHNGNMAEETRTISSRTSEKEVIQGMASKETFLTTFGKGQTKCSICKDNFKKPKIVPCSHVFCMHCLKETGTVTNKNPGDMMPCERCGQEFIIIKEGFVDLENFEPEENMIRVAQVLHPSSTHTICETCSEKSALADAPDSLPAAMHCADCNNKLCDDCRRCGKSLLREEVKNFEDVQTVSAAVRHQRMKSKTVTRPMSSSSAFTSDCTFADASLWALLQREGSHLPLKHLCASVAPSSHPGVSLQPHSYDSFIASLSSSSKITSTSPDLLLTENKYWLRSYPPAQTLSTARQGIMTFVDASQSGDECQVQSVVTRPWQTVYSSDINQQLLVSLGTSVPLKQKPFTAHSLVTEENQLLDMSSKVQPSSAPDTEGRHTKKRKLRLQCK